MIDDEEGVIRNTNGQLIWNYGKGFVQVDTPTSQGAGGFLQAAGRNTTSDLIIESANEYGTLVAVSLDGRPLADSTAILIQAATREKLHGYETETVEGGALKKPTTLMSRNWMTSCWSWDHCFNAIAYAPRNPDTAWDQLNVHFHLQEPGGCLPDGVNAEVCGWNFCKPPIHGWALNLMEHANPGLLDEERLRDFYPKLCRWTEWWFETRDADGDGLPEYRHGNDSGWDNSTAFDVGFPNCAPDLQGHLVTQMEQLARMADRLGLDAEAAVWRERRDRHVALTIERLWDEEAGQFRAFQAFSGKREETGNSLLNHMIIVMGEHLPQPYRDRVAEFLRPDGPFVTEYGPATEAPESPKYLYSGYWHGAIWPSSTVLLIDGLWRGGYAEQAREIARRYCEMAKKTLTFAENYDPLNGDPLCDKAYTWGSSGFLILANWLKTRGD